MPVTKQRASRIYVAEYEVIKDGRVFYRFVKRCMDLILSLAAMPLYLILYVLAGGCH